MSRCTEIVTSLFFPFSFGLFESIFFYYFLTWEKNRVGFLPGEDAFGFRGGANLYDFMSCCAARRALVLFRPVLIELKILL